MSLCSSIERRFISIDRCPADKPVEGKWNMTSRREFLQRFGSGFGLLGLASLLERQGLLSSPRRWPPSDLSLNPLAPRPAHFPAKAKRVIWLFMNGGPSQVDTWDYKPELEKRDGKIAGRLRSQDRVLYRAGRRADEVAVPIRPARAVGRLGVGDLSASVRSMSTTWPLSIVASPKRTTIRRRCFR